jgi:hypothetical protein
MVGYNCPQVSNKSRFIATTLPLFYDMLLGGIAIEYILAHQLYHSGNYLLVYNRLSFREKKASFKINVYAIYAKEK